MKNSRYFFAAFACFLFVLLHAPCLFASGDTLSLSWSAPIYDSDGSPLTDLDGYKVYYGTSSRHYTHVIDVGNTTTCEASDLSDGATYYFAVTAYDLSGNESDYSGEIIKTVSGGGSFSTSSVSLFMDDFGSDSTGGYTVSDTWTKGGTGGLIYLAAGQRVRVRTGDNIGTKFSNTFMPAQSGTFSMDFLPYNKYPAGGELYIRLIEDNNNYYEMHNTDGYGPGYLIKVVGGEEVERAEFTNGYYQNSDYTLSMDFDRGSILLDAFGEMLGLQDTRTIVVDKFEVEMLQQDAYIDNIIVQ